MSSLVLTLDLSVTNTAFKTSSDFSEMTRGQFRSFASRCLQQSPRSIPRGGGVSSEHWGLLRGGTGLRWHHSCVTARSTEDCVGVARLLGGAAGKHAPWHHHGPSSLPKSTPPRPVKGMVATAPPLALPLGGALCTGRPQRPCCSSPQPLDSTRLFTEVPVTQRYPIKPQLTTPRTPKATPRPSGLLPLSPS